MGKSVTREQIHEMLDLVLDINGMEARTREKTGDKPTVFVRFYGHTCSLEIDIYKKGWSPNVGSDACERIYLDDLCEGSTPVKDVIKLLKSIKK